MLSKSMYLFLDNQKMMLCFLLNGRGVRNCASCGNYDFQTNLFFDLLINFLLKKRKYFLIYQTAPIFILFYQLWLFAKNMTFKLPYDPQKSTPFSDVNILGP